MTITIIRDESELNKLITLTIQTGKKYAERLHVATLSAVVHLLEHGQPGPLNRLYVSMNSNNSAAFKQFLRRLNLYVGMGWETVEKTTIDDINKLDKDIRNGYIRDGMVIDYEDKTFFVASVKTDPRAKEKRLLGVKFVEQRFLESTKDNKKYAPWYDRNNFAEVRYLGDAEVFAQIKRVLSSVEKPGQRVNAAVSGKMKDMLKTFVDNAENLVEQEGLTERNTSREESIVAMAEVANAGKRSRSTKAGDTPPVVTH